MGYIPHSSSQTIKGPCGKRRLDKTNGGWQTSEFARTTDGVGVESTEDVVGLKNAGNNKTRSGIFTIAALAFAKVDLTMSK